MRGVYGSAANSATNHRYWLGIGALLAIISSIILVGLLSFSLVYAQESDRENIAMSPTSQDYTIEVGKGVNGKFTIYNHGDTSYEFIVYARPYSITDNKYDSPDFVSSVQNADLYKWIQFPKSKYHLEPKTSVDVPYTIRIPDGATPGGHYGVIFAEVQPKEEKGSGNAIIHKKRVGSIMYATVKGDVKLAGESLGTTIPFWQVQPPLKVTTLIKNTGNTHFKNETILTVRDVFGNVKYRVKKDYYVLPSTTRTIDMTWENASWFGLYRVEAEQKFLDKTVKTEGFVLMMPRFIPVALLVIILIGGAYAVVARRREK